MLRSELGDADYTRYLDAVGRPTEVMFDVFAGSYATHDAERAARHDELNWLPASQDVDHYWRARVAFQG